MQHLEYLILTIIMMIILITGSILIINKTFEPAKRAKKIWLVISLLILWQVYIYLIALSGIPQDYSLPPKGILILVFPPFIFTGIFLYFNRNEAWIKNIPEHWLIFYQSFRVLVELTFAWSVIKGALHPNVSIHGYNYDLIFGLTAPFTGYYLYKKGLKTKKIVQIWNYAGLIILASAIFVFSTTTFFPELYGSNEVLMPKDFGLYPIVTMPGFLMPSAVFIHVLSIVQLSRKS